VNAGVLRHTSVKPFALRVNAFDSENVIENNAGF